MNPETIPQPTRGPAGYAGFRATIKAVATGPRGSRDLTFAEARMHHRVSTALRKEGRLIRLPKGADQVANRVGLAIRRLEAQQIDSDTNGADGGALSPAFESQRAAMILAQCPRSKTKAAGKRREKAPRGGDCSALGQIPLLFLFQPRGTGTPAIEEVPGIAKLVGTAPIRLGNVMTYDAPRRYEIDEPILPRTQAKVDVFETVAIDFVEAARAQEPFAKHEAAGGRHAGELHIVARGLDRGEGIAMVERIPAQAKNDSGVIDFAGFGVELDVPHDAGTGMACENGEHRFEPAGLQHKIVVEKREKFASGDARSAIV